VNASDQSVEDGQDQFDWMIIAGTLWKRGLFLQIPFQSQLFAKLMNKEDAPKVSQVALSKGKM
jgi:hypothetical protein